jgi:predicted protein tyrosine phosphatase
MAYRKRHRETTTMSRAASKKESKKESMKATVMTITLGDIAENHAGMQKIGKLHDKGYSVEKLHQLGEQTESVKALTLAKKLLDV